MGTHPIFESDFDCLTVGICVGPCGDGPKMCENVESFSYVRVTPRNSSPNTPIGVLKIISSSRSRELVKKLKSEKTSRLTRTDKRLLCYITFKKLLITVLKMSDILFFLNKRHFIQK